MPVALAVDPAYNLLFVADKGSDAIMVFTISPVSFNSPAALTVKTSFAIQTPAAGGGSGPAALGITPTGFSCVDNRTPNPLIRNCFALYAANQIAGTVTVYDYFADRSGNFVLGSVDLSGNFIVGGTVVGSPYSAGTNPSALAFSGCAGVGTGTGVTSCQAADAKTVFSSPTRVPMTSPFSQPVSNCRLATPGNSTRMELSPRLVLRSRQVAAQRLCWLFLLRTLCTQWMEVPTRCRSTSTYLLAAL